MTGDDIDGHDARHARQGGAQQEVQGSASGARPAGEAGSPGLVRHSASILVTMTPGHYGAEIAAEVLLDVRDGLAESRLVRAGHLESLGG